MTKHRARTSDEPALDPRVREVFVAAAAPVDTSGPLPGEEQALTAFRASAQRTRRSPMFSPLVSAKTAAVSAMAAGVMLTGGVGAAAAGILPGPAQQTASTVLETVGISVPAGNGADHDSRPEQPSDRADEHANPPGSAGAEVPPAADHGKQVSKTAKNTTADGKDKGQQIAGVASDGKAKSGDHHGQPPVSPPNAGGTGTAPDPTNGQDQSAGASDHGTTTANESSNGASTSGSGNSPEGN